ncbi:unnamed protein product [Prorocentrum cordatum]|uniref:Uncharacterized protein n=1 Tax=Prorocentrum cordatum TaxID=2364126 RepID=A0ABN9X1P2_9DINO|nr:unnamed protein product [Polarella glacialis]
MAGMKQYWLGSPDSDDRQRSPDEVRIIREMTTQEVEAFLTANPVDAGSANQLRNEPPYIALQVIDRGNLRGCRDPSGVLVARMRDARRGTLIPGPSAQPPPVVQVDPNASEVEKFCAMNRIDLNATHALKAESEEVQRAVMARGQLTSARNPSGSLMARIRVVKEAGAAALLPGGQPTASLMGQQPAALMAILGLPQPGAIPSGPVPGQPPPPLALTGGATAPAGGAGGISMDVAGEALKAIQKMSQAPPGGAPAGDGPMDMLAAAEKQLREQKAAGGGVNPEDI